MLQQLQVQRVVAIAQCHAARLVVCGYHYQRLIGVRLIERICHTQRLIHGYHFAECRCSVVAVARIVYHATLHHHEESLVLAAQEGDSRAHYLLQRQIIRLAVNGIGNVIRRLVAVDTVGALHEYHLLCVHQSLCLLKAVRQRVALLLAEVVEVRALTHNALRVPDKSGQVRLVESSTTEEVEVGESQLFAYLVVHLAAGHMGIERPRRGMVNRH